MEISSINLDLAQKVFQVHGIRATGEVVIRKALRQSQMLPFFEKLCEAICEAVTRQTMQFVLIKSREQQAALALHSGQDREGRLSGF